MISFFYKDTPVGAIGLIILSIVAIVGLFYGVGASACGIALNPLFLGEIWSVEDTCWLNLFGTIFLTIINAVGLVFLLNTKEVFQKSSYVAGLLYIVFSLAGISFSAFNMNLLTDSISLIILYQLFSLYNSKSSEKSLFNIGFWFFLLIVINPVYTCVLLVILFAFLEFGQLSFKKLLIFILGTLTPFYLLWLWHFVYDQPIFWDGFNLGYFHYADKFTALLSLDVVTMSVLVILGLTSLLALYQYGANVARSSVKSKKYNNILAVSVLVGLLINVIDGAYDMWSYQALLIPVSALLSMWFLNRNRKNLRVIFFWFVTILIIIGSFSTTLVRIL